MKASGWNKDKKPLYYNDGSPCNLAARGGCAPWACKEVKRRFDSIRMCFKCLTRHRPSDPCVKKGSRRGKEGVFNEDK